MRDKFEEQLARLNDMLIEMGALIEKAIALAVNALARHDSDLAGQAVAFDSEIDRKEKEIEALCLKLFLQQQPVARDLWLISAAMKMITDMERIGDHAVDISETALLLAQAPYTSKPEHLPQMAEAATRMVTDSIDAFVKKDLALAKAVIAYDDVVDALFDTVRLELIELIHSEGSNREQAMDLLMAAKCFERIGDHATNIAEWVEFSITGKQGKG